MLVPISEEEPVGFVPGPGGRFSLTAGTFRRGRGWMGGRPPAQSRGGAVSKGRRLPWQGRTPPVSFPLILFSRFPHQPCASLALPARCRQTKARRRRRIGCVAARSCSGAPELPASLPAVRWGPALGRSLPYSGRRFTRSGAARFVFTWPLPLLPAAGPSAGPRPGTPRRSASAPARPGRRGPRPRRWPPSPGASGPTPPSGSTPRA
jgi:hypothetical protein